MAARIKAAVHDATGLTCSICVAPNKLLAKIGSELDKPNGLTILTPAGSDGSSSFSRALTRSITRSAFSPWRMTMMPVTVSPVPSRSATPRRMSGPSVTVPMSRTRTADPDSDRARTMFPMSSVDVA